MQFIFMVITILVLQIYLSKCKNKFLGLIIPTVSFLIVIAVLCSVLPLMFADINLIPAILISLLTVFLYSIPPLILLLIYLKFHKHK